MKKLNRDSRQVQFGSLDEILDYAIQNEQEAYRFYTQWSKKVEKDAIKKVFSELAREETKHEQFLLDYKAGKKHSFKIEKVRDLKISDYLIESQASLDMDYQDALILAMHREKNAFKLYNRLAEITESEEHQKMFQMLASQEAKHKLRLEMIYDDDVLIEN